MQEDVRRILKVAAPFAGVALGWYLFMPNIRTLISTGTYRSQLLINLQQLRKAGSDVKYELTSSKEQKAYDECFGKTFRNWIEGGYEERKPYRDKFGDDKAMDAYMLEKCGPAPAED